jgi:hypothetical protein
VNRLLIQSGVSVTFISVFLERYRRRNTQSGATVHTANYSINILNDMFEDRLITRKFWPAKPPHLNPYDF